MNAMLLAVTGVSLLAAGFMSAIVWRMRREEWRRSDARVAALSSVIYDDNDDGPSAGHLFQEPPASPAARHGVVAIVGACVVSAVAGLTMVAARGPHRAPARAAAARQSPDAPLELLALEHEREGDQLIVRGIVRNPPDAAARDGLAAVVLLFGRDGALITTGRAAVPARRLAPGATTPFVVNIVGASDVDRFRLSFRTDARIEPHVDRRTS
jgi:hypothetical protein